MRKLLVLLTYCIYVINLSAQVTVVDAVNGFNEIAGSATDAASNCDGLQRRGHYQVNLEGNPDDFHKEVRLETRPSGALASFKEDEVSILTEEEAKKLFEEFSKIDYMKFDYLHDGCFARAHEFSLIAKQHGIEMGKVFLSESNQGARLYPKEWLGNPDAPVPAGFVGWRYHVTPYVLVKKGDELVPVVFDVGVSPRPKTVEDWQNDMIQGHPENFSLTFRDSRYMYEDSRTSYEGQSNIQGQLEDQEMMRKLGIDEFLFRREQGWL